MFNFFFSIIVIYIAIAYLFGFTLFKWAIPIGLIIGFFAILYPPISQTPEYKKFMEWLTKRLKKVWHIIWD